MTNLFQELSDAVENKSVVDLAAAARRSLAQNIECYLAQFFLKHPEANPLDYELCYAPSMTSCIPSYRFWMRRKD